MDILVKKHNFDIVLAAGDTTTVLVSSLIAFYNHIPFAHIEAGLRTYNSKEPFPEEINRILVAPLATVHFVPTALEKDNLVRENVNPAKIMITGNPVIDSLYWVLKKPTNRVHQKWSNAIIVTAHRRENFGDNIKNICQAISELAIRFPQVNFVFPVHPNPNVQNDIGSLLKDKKGIHLLPPLGYEEFAHLMNDCLFVLTDSGGIQEEAPALGKPVLVLRNITERPAIISEGLGLLIGATYQQIIANVSSLLTDENHYRKMAKGISPYGDGRAAERIVDYLQEIFIKS